MKKITLVVWDELSKDKYVRDLEEFFGKYVEIDSYSLKEGIDKKIDGDLVISCPILKEYVDKYIPENIDIVYPTRSIYLEGYNKLKEIENGQRALLVSNSNFFALDLLSFLNRIEITNVNFYPFFPGMKNVPDIELAVTPGQTAYVPKNIKKIIDIGWRVFDYQTLLSIAKKLDIKDHNVIKKIKEYDKKLLPVTYGMHSILDDIIKSKTNLSIILEEVDDGILIIDSKNKIQHYNKALEEIFKTNSSIIIGSKVEELEIFHDIYKLLEDERIIENRIINISHKNLSLLITKKPLIEYEQIFGYVYIIKKVSSIEKLEGEIRKKLSEKGHIARNSFDSIIGKSNNLIECKRKAMKMSNLDKPVLIIGETGTGKELFAQSIHNHSKRKNEPFVAVNCAALPTELLESELFGYEEGAFTGAKKGGKKGLFEIAHNGTLFLDEIGEISLKVQAKLLRVLQEKEVMRIGGLTTFTVNVRIIAATNKDFKKLMHEGKVRKDLYYRLSVLNLKTPSLNEIREDIPYIVENILEKTGVKKKIKPELMDVLINRKWDGNVRELENYIQYSAYMSDDIIDFKDLPDDFFEKKNELENLSVLYELLEDEKTIAVSILKILKYRNAGRRTIIELLKNQNIETTEYEIKKLLKYMKDKNLLHIVKGRKGVEITSEGRRILYRY